MNMTIAHQTVFDEHGKPTAVLIPWDVFLRVREELGDIADDDEITPEIREALEEAARDRAEGNTDAFTSLEDVMAEMRANA